jgi:peptidoglycan/xylan/chitin deacetylase (PgdA/CDA1 family)
MKAIMYHYVRPDDPALPYFRHLSVDNFLKQLDFFASQFRFLSKDEFLWSLKTSTPVQDGIILTFDDGFKDHYQYVLPALKKRGLWGIFYIAVAPYVTRKLIDVHRIHMLLGKYGGERILASMGPLISENILSDAYRAEFRELTYKFQNNDEYTNIVKRTLNYYISYEHRGRIIDDLMSVFFPDEKTLVENFYMTSDEIYELHKAGMIIGSHSVNHFLMSKLMINDQQKEIEASFSFLEGVIGKVDVKTFCYPYGGFYSFTDDTQRLLDQNDCLFSFNVESRDIEKNDLLEKKQVLPRYDCNLFPFGSIR